MFGEDHDEGWTPAVRGLLTWRVWRPGRSSVLARIRAVWILMFLAMQLLIGVALGFKGPGVLARWVVYVGWSSFAVFALLAIYGLVRLRRAILAARSDEVAVVALRSWLVALVFATAPVLSAVSLLQATSGDDAVGGYPVFWAAAVTLPLLVLLLPSVTALGRLEAERITIDGVSFVASVMAPTAKIDRGQS